MRRTSRAVIIEEGKLLLVTAHGSGYYWLPGGTVEEDESTIDALHREVKEELGTEVDSYEPYRSYNIDDREIDVFIVTIKGNISIDNEITNYVWYSRDQDVEIG